MRRVFRIFGMWLLLVAIAGASVSAQQTVFVVRHAERADGGAGAGGSMASTDPELSEAGKARAQSLANALKDAGIKAIYVTEFKRTQQTAAPLAAALNIQPTVVPAKDVAALVERLKAGSGNALVVAHSNTVPDLIKRLGVVEPVNVADADYDNLFVVTQGSTPSLLRLHFR
jgi:broad specificity phosphatase PhoE